MEKKKLLLMGKKIENYKENLIFLIIFISIHFISLHIFPTQGNLHILDVQKLLNGGILYGNVKNVSPPFFYLVLFPFVSIGIKSLLFYRILGELLLFMSIVIFSKIIKVFAGSSNSVLITAAAYTIYIATPWEIFSTYLYLATTFCFISLYFFWKKPTASMFFAGLALSTKVPIGGALIIGYLLFLIINASIGRRFNFKIVYFTLVLIISSLIPVIIFSIFGIKFSIEGLFITFSGESKGDFLNIILYPIRNFLDNFILLFNEENYLANLKDIYYGFYNVFHIGLIMGIYWFGSVILYFYQTYIYIKLKRFSKIQCYFPILVSLIGISYASAMSSFFKPDDIFIIVFLLVAIFRYMEYSKRFIFYALILLSPLLISFSEFYKSFYFFVLLIFFILNYNFSIFKKFRCLNYIIVLFILIFYTHYKTYNTVWSWWGSYINGNAAVYSEESGFFMTPFYSELYQKLNSIFKYSAVNKLPATLYSFPTSALPYNIFDRPSSTQFEVHHADVFPKRYLNSELNIIYNEVPTFIIYNLWPDNALKSLDDMFSAGTKSSQHQMRDELLKFILQNYKICSIIYDNWNYPIIIYINNNEYYSNKNISQICL